MPNFLTYSLENYYGTDIIAQLFLFSSIYLLGNNKRSGFLLGIAAGICFIILNYIINSPVGVAGSTGLAILNLRGFLKWEKSKA